LAEESFKHFAKSGRHLITRIGKNEDNKSWCAEAYFLVEGDVAQGKRLL
jgi:hypothetical protein